jgi:hypothetical protein
MTIHESIKNKLDYFIENKKIPHIVFHGAAGSGKRTVLNYLMKSIYKTNDEIKNYVMYINCAHGKGIRFIRDELKFFSKTNIQNKNGNIFKSVVLFNADKLTTDAQSALRRCIEQFSHTTRFFIIIDEQRKLLKPIISRFCNIHVPLPVIDNKKQSLHTYNKSIINDLFIDDENKRYLWLFKNLENKKNFKDIKTCITLSDKLYQKAYSAIDLMNYIQKSKKIDTLVKYKILIYFDKARLEFRNEKILIFNILVTLLMRHKYNLENIDEM